MAENFQITGSMENQLPRLFTERMKSFLQGEYDTFIFSLDEMPPVAVRINPYIFTGRIPAEHVPWCDTGFYLESRPLFTADPWFHAGAYYVQEPSSMFLEQAFLSAGLPENAVILDLCGAPGGKATHLLSLLRPGDLLVTNEVIRGRSMVLQENVRKWGIPDVVVTQNDPADFGNAGPLFDLVVVDAPCSGEGLFRKERAAINEWSVENTNLCSARQRRILAEAWKCLRPGGCLIYSTCTFNPAENEENMEWLTNQDEAQFVKIDIKPEWNIRGVPSEMITGYRFFPHLVKGEGFFLAMVRKNGERKSSRFTGKNTLKKWAALPGKAAINFRGWLHPECNGEFFLKNDDIFFFPSLHIPLIGVLEKHLNILQAGTPVASGDEKHPQPHPALALSAIYQRGAFPETDLTLTNAIGYLRRESLPVISGEKGWGLVTYRDVPLGWIKNLGNRTNNYFPKEWRIRMEIKEIPRPWHEAG